MSNFLINYNYGMKYIRNLTPFDYICYFITEYNLT